MAPMRPPEGTDHPMWEILKDYIMIELADCWKPVAAGMVALYLYARHIRNGQKT